MWGFVQSVCLYVYFLDFCGFLVGVVDSVHGRTDTARWIVIKVQILAK